MKLDSEYDDLSGKNETEKNEIRSQIESIRTKVRTLKNKEIDLWANTTGEDEKRNLQKDMDMLDVCTSALDDLSKDVDD